MDLLDMKNIGVEMKRKLNTVGVNNAEQLKGLGSKEAFLKLKSAYPEVCLVHLYTLQGAIDNTDFDMLPTDVKRDLKSYSNSLK